MPVVILPLFTFPFYLMLAVFDDHSSRRLLAFLWDNWLYLPCFNRSGCTVEMLPEKIQRSPDRSLSGMQCYMRSILVLIPHSSGGLWLAKDFFRHLILFFLLFFSLLVSGSFGTCASEVLLGFEQGNCWGLDEDKGFSHLKKNYSPYCWQNNISSSQMEPILIKTTFLMSSHRLGRYSNNHSSAVQVSHYLIFIMSGDNMQILETTTITAHQGQHKKLSAGAQSTLL